MTGGSGADTFVFDNFDMGDVIADYQTGDKIDLTALFADTSFESISEACDIHDVDGSGGVAAQTIATIDVGGGHPAVGTLTIIFDSRSPKSRRSRS